MLVFFSRSPKYIEVDETVIDNEDYNVEYCAASTFRLSNN